MKRKVEYVWLDGYTPEPNLRSKVRMVDLNTEIVSDIPAWGFDGSSTKQVEGNFFDCYLKPVKVYRTNNLK
jgi:glutamine synthetase